MSWVVFPVSYGWLSLPRWLALPIPLPAFFGGAVLVVVATERLLVGRAGISQRTRLASLAEALGGSVTQRGDRFPCPVVAVRLPKAALIAQRSSRSRQTTRHDPA
jgi:hypothetical protein